MKTIVYLHGFMGSPASKKAAMLGDYLRANAPDIDFRVPALDHRPAIAVSQARRHGLGVDPEDLLVVGSSLGGFYATVMAEESGCRAVVINPVVHPQDLFGRYLGLQRNLYTGERFELTPEHVAQMAALDPAAIARPGQYWLLVETGDEVLDYREALVRYEGAFQTVVRGGEHAFGSFPEFVPDIVAWARESATRPLGMTS